MNNTRRKILLLESGKEEINCVSDTFKEYDRELNTSTLVCDYESGAKAFKNIVSSKNRLPDLILININTFNKDSFNFLGKIKTNILYKHIPVIVLIGPDLVSSEQESYCIGANCCITKTKDPIENKKILKALANFWFFVAKLPNT